MTTMMIVKPLHLFQTSNTTAATKTSPFSQSPRSLSKISCVSSPQTPTRLLVDEFNPKIPIEKALTPPSSWYTHPSFLSLELDRVFYKGWQAVGYSEQVKEVGDFFTGRLGNIEYVVCRDDNGELHAFHNVCRHHASLIAFESGKKACFTCPYHGWTYGLDGTLLKATRITGIQNFNVKVCSKFNCSASEILSVNGVDSSLSYLCRQEYIIECNWKVFCDNYLDGGYHVPYAHKGLASGLNLESYSTSVFEKVSIQRCYSGQVDSHEDTDRLGSKALYAFIYPNFMINRYGPWMDTNLVLPLGPRKCQVIFDYFLDPNLKDDKEFIESSLKDSENVQDEDTFLCEAVQKGLESPAYSSGRYAPAIEKAMHHFHCLLHKNLVNE
ncbi:choline monooxygenase, chloroplastic isoform X2 [Daucus carota subsp. sativus]|uniref:choline monooxygenase, chloroplastic isoform X2 n=1 Tax=Daucus carota subsp. sativus TaxID=79200 RepID=UPI0007F01E8A|nr:PREDICTED: choline monooxygenase, chloroplastic isoform X2 [Daucus carota subsp. sativus]